MFLKSSNTLSMTFIKQPNLYYATINYTLSMTFIKQLTKLIKINQTIYYTNHHLFNK